MLGEPRLDRVERKGDDVLVVGVRWPRRIRRTRRLTDFARVPAGLERRAERQRALAKFVAPRGAASLRGLARDLVDLGQQNNGLGDVELFVRKVMRPALKHARDVVRRHRRDRRGRHRAGLGERAFPGLARVSLQDALLREILLEPPERRAIFHLGREAREIALDAEQASDERAHERSDGEEHVAHLFGPHRRALARAVRLVRRRHLGGGGCQLGAEGLVEIA